MFVVHFNYVAIFHAVSLQIATLTQSTLNTMTASDASQTTPVQIIHVFMRYCSTQIVQFLFQ